MSSFRLAGELGIPRTQAAAFLDAYTTTYAGVQRYFTDTIMDAEKTGYVETLFGRRRYLPDIISKNKVVKAAAERVARNTPIQGTAADIVKKAMIALDGALKADGSPAKALLQVHDELIFECPESASPKAAALIKDVMEGVVKLKVPLRVSVETGKKWGDFH
jgi:DNA polymerase-1